MALKRRINDPYVGLSKSNCDPEPKRSKHDPETSLHFDLDLLISRDFELSIQNKFRELTEIDKRLQEARKLLNLVRYASVKQFYSKRNIVNAESNNTKDDQGVSEVCDINSRLHPAVTMLNGKTKRPARSAALKATQTLKEKLLKTKTEPVTLQSLKILPDKELKLQIKDSGPTLLTEVTSVDKQAIGSYGPERDNILANVDSSVSALPPILTEPSGPRAKTKYTIIVGNISKRLGDNTSGSCTHKWLVYVRTSENSPNISQIVYKVKFYLHPSYKPNDIIDVIHPPFQISKRGWGEFPLRIQLFFKCQDKPLFIVHGLKLGHSHLGVNTFSSETVVHIWLNNIDNNLKDTNVSDNNITVSSKTDRQKYDSINIQPKNPLINNIIMDKTVIHKADDVRNLNLKELRNSVFKDNVCADLKCDKKTSNKNTNHRLMNTSIVESSSHIDVKTVTVNNVLNKLKVSSPKLTDKKSNIKMQQQSDKYIHGQPQFLTSVEEQIIKNDESSYMVTNLKLACTDDKMNTNESLNHSQNIIENKDVMKSNSALSVKYTIAESVNSVNKVRLIKSNLHNVVARNKINNMNLVVKEPLKFSKSNYSNAATAVNDHPKSQDTISNQCSGRLISSSPSFCINSSKVVLSNQKTNEHNLKKNIPKIFVSSKTPLNQNSFIISKSNKVLIKNPKFLLKNVSVIQNASPLVLKNARVIHMQPTGANNSGCLVESCGSSIVVVEPKENEKVQLNTTAPINRNILEGNNAILHNDQKLTIHKKETVMLIKNNHFQNMEPLCTNKNAFNRKLFEDFKTIIGVKKPLPLNKNSQNELSVFKKKPVSTIQIFKPVEEIFQYSKLFLKMYKVEKSFKDCCFDNTEHAIDFLIRRMPLVRNDNVEMSLGQSSCLPKLECYCILPWAKQRYIEWSRSMIIKNILSRNKTLNQQWSTKDISRFSKQRGYLPVNKQQFTSSFNRAKINHSFKSLSVINSNLIKQLDRDHCSPVEDFTVNIETDIEEKPDVIQPKLKQSEFIPLNSNIRPVALWAARECAAMKITLEPELLDTEEYHEGALHMISIAAKSFIEDLLRRSIEVNCVTQSRDVTVEHVFAALMNRKEFDFLTNNSLGMK